MKTIPVEESLWTELFIDKMKMSIDSKENLSWTEYIRKKTGIEKDE